MSLVGALTGARHWLSNFSVPRSRIFPISIHLPLLAVASFNVRLGFHSHSPRFQNSHCPDHGSSRSEFSYYFLRKPALMFVLVFIVVLLGFKIHTAQITDLLDPILTTSCGSQP